MQPDLFVDENEQKRIEMEKKERKRLALLRQYHMLKDKAEKMWKEIEEKKTA